MSEVTNPVALSAKGPLTLINLTDLPDYKKVKTWRLIQEENPKLAKMLRSQAFKEAKANIEAVFGTVKILIEPTQIGGSEYGISSRIKEQN